MRRLLQKALSSLLYPTRRVQLHLTADWYVRKGYGKPGRSSGMPWLLDPFEDFVQCQQNNPKSHYHKAFKSYFWMLYFINHFRNLKIRSTFEN